MKFTRLSSYSTYIKFEGTDVWVDERNLHTPYYANLNDYRHRTYIMERAASQDAIERKKKRKEPENKELLEEGMTKLKDRLDWLGPRMKRFEERLVRLEKLLDAHISNDSSGVITVASTISSLGDEVVDWDCLCNDNVHCAKHPKRDECHRGY